MRLEESNVEKIWTKVKERLAQTLPSNLFNVWIEPLVLLEAKEGQIILGCPNRFFLQWVKEHFFHLLKETWKFYWADIIGINLQIIKAKRSEITKTQTLRSQPPLPLAYPKLCQDFTFKEFIVGKTNQYAYKTAYNLAHHPFSQPVFFYSDTGLGKTHLSQAIANHIIMAKKPLKLFYVTAEDFTNEMVNSLKNQQISMFKEKYRKQCDIFILENFHFLSGKEKTQTELTYTIDALQREKKGVVFTSLTSPQNIHSLKRELRSRLESGLLIPIEPPDFKMRLEILKARAKRKNVIVPENVLQYLAQHIDGDIRRLEGAFNNLISRSFWQKAPIDLKLTKEVIEIFIKNQYKTDLTKIKKTVCQYYKISTQELISNSRQKRILLPRKIAIYLAKQHLNLSLIELANGFNRHHSTIINALNATTKEIKKQTILTNEIKYLSQKIKEETN
jgi:chromosomal replication initiator protein